MYCAWRHSVYEDATPSSRHRAIAFQQASLAARNFPPIKGNNSNQAFEELGEAMSLGRNAPRFWLGAKLRADNRASGRFARYTSRLPTWHHRLRVGGLVFWRH